jgi:hypothetical protein
MEFQIKCRLGYEVSGPASFLFHVAVAQNSFQRIITEHFEVGGAEYCQEMSAATDFVMVRDGPSRTGAWTGNIRYGFSPTSTTIIIDKSDQATTGVILFRKWSFWKKEKPGKSVSSFEV